MDISEKVNIFQIFRQVSVWRLYGQSVLGFWRAGALSARKKAHAKFAKFAKF